MTRTPIRTARRGLHAQIHTRAGWETLTPGWMAHWTASESGPILYAQANNPESRITQPWRVRAGTRLIAASTPHDLTEKGAP